jgi:hypothetical protein
LPAVPPTEPWIVPQAPHPGQRPTHRATCCRQSEQAKIVRGRAMTIDPSHGV